MDKYIGLDVHAISCTMVVLGMSGRRLSSRIVETNGHKLVEALEQVSGKKHLCMEEGTQSAWLHEILSPHVAELVVLGVGKDMVVSGNKNDAEDAYRLAEMLRTGAIRTRVYKPTGRFKTLRALVKAYGYVTEDVVRSQNRVKAIYRGQGVLTPGRAVYNAKKRATWTKQLPKAIHSAAEVLHDEVNALGSLKDVAEGVLLAELKKHAAGGLLLTVPGLGPIRVAQLMSVVVTPERFRTRRQFWSYCGLGIMMRSSSDWVPSKGGWARAEVNRTRGLNKNHNQLLKSVFKGAATTVITQMPNQPLHQEYETLLKNGTKPNLAKLTIARKIAAIALAIWKTKTPYDAEKHVRKPEASTTTAQSS